VSSVFRTFSLPNRGRQVLGADLNCSESRLAGPQSASSHTRIAHGERLGGHGVGCTTHFSALGVHVRPARSIFSNALNFCRSAIAALVRSIVVAHRTLPDDLVYGIAEAVFANPDEMMQIHNTAADTVPTNFARNTILPFHDGAARWYHNKSTSGVVHGD